MRYVRFQQEDDVLAKFEVYLQYQGWQIHQGYCPRVVLGSL